MSLLNELKQNKAKKSRDFKFEDVGQTKQIENKDGLNFKVTGDNLERAQSPEKQTS